MSFNLIKDKRGVVVVGVDGQLIVGNRQELKQKVLDALEGTARKIREQGGDLRLAGLNEDLQTLFELTKLDTLFAIAKTPEEALAAF
jgi:anti-sigma B factor antagonist